MTFGTAMVAPGAALAMDVPAANPVPSGTKLRNRTLMHRASQPRTREIRVAIDLQRARGNFAARIIKVKAFAKMPQRCADEPLDRSAGMDCNSAAAATNLSAL